MAVGCEGPYELSVGTMTTQFAAPGEPEPDRSTWNMSVGNSWEGYRYTGTKWSSEIVCGKVEVKLAENEMYYDETRPSIVVDGMKHVAIMRGDEEGFGDHLAAMGVRDLLDAVTEMQIAEANGDYAAAEDAVGKVEDRGFGIAGVAGRDDGKRK